MKNNRRDRRRKDGDVTGEPKVAPAAAPPNKSHSAWTWLKMIGAIIGGIAAVVGIVTGALFIKDYLERSSVRIVFNEAESMLCVIANSLDMSMEGKFAILLYGVKIVGKGTENFVTQDVTISIRSKGQWYEGTRFSPVKREERDRNGPIPPQVRLNAGVRKRIESKEGTGNGKLDVGDTLMVGDWRDFVPGIKLGHGDPDFFMVAAYFPSSPTDVGDFDRLRIVVSDHLGNANVEEYGTESFKRFPFTMYLDQSPS